MPNLKLPPNSIEAEQAVIGAVLLSPTCFNEVDWLQPEDFFRHQHAELWSIIRRSEESRDIVAIMSASTPENMVYISDLARNTPSAANVKVYAQIVRERAMLRRLLRACWQVADSITNDSKASDVVAGAVREMQAIADGAIVGDGPRHISDLAGDWYDDFSKRAAADGIVGYSVGFRSLDMRWGGLRGGQVVVIAGRPKTGKSTLAQNIAEHVSQSHPVAVFQMEMSANEMVDRTVSSVSGVAINSIRTGQLDDDNDGWERLTRAMQKLKSSKLFIDPTPRQTMDTIRMHAKAFVQRHGKGVIFIDYLGLIRSNGQARTKNDDVSEISRDVKLLAKETDCAVVLLCQMNRNVEREKRKPQLSDLRDSGAIEQDADIICFTHKDDPEQTYSEIITRAMRSGQPGTDMMICDFHVSRFTEPEEGWDPPNRGAKSEKAERKGLKS